MTVKQISVFVENKPGRLAEMAALLGQQDIDMRALSIAEAEDFGIVRIIVDDAYNTAQVLKEAGYVFSITPVLAAAIPDEPRGLSRILDLLGENGINLEYTYAFIAREKGLAYMIMRVTNNEKAIEVLSKQGIRLVCQHEIAEI